jgi:hypothetical protein
MIWFFIAGAFAGFFLGLIIMSIWIIASRADERLAQSGSTALSLHDGVDQ